MKKWWKWIIALIIISLGIAIYQNICMSCVSWEVFKPENIQKYFLSLGAWAIIVYIILYAINTVVLLPPIGIMSLTAGAVFGPLWGTIAIMMGSFLGTTSTFFISRKLGGPFVQKIVKGKAKEFQDKLDDNGFKVVLAIRLIPVLSWEVVNYASGLSKMKYRDYILATMIGVFPAVLIQTFFSHSLVSFDWKDPKIWIAIGLFILLGAIPALYLKIKNKKGKDDE